MRAIDFDRIEAAPLPVRAAGHVCDHDMRVEVRVGTVAVFNAAGGTGRDVIEARGDEIAGHDPFATASAPRERIMFELHQCATDCLPVRFDKAAIVSDQPLNAHRLRCVEGGVPAGAPVVVAVRFMNEHLAGRGAKPAQHGAEVFGRNLAGKSQLLSAASEPLPYDPLLLRVIVVVRVLLFVVGLGLGGGERAFGHYQH